MTTVSFDICHMTECRIEDKAGECGQRQPYFGHPISKGVVYVHLYYFHRHHDYFYRHEERGVYLFPWGGVRWKGVKTHAICIITVLVLKVLDCEMIVIIFFRILSELEVLRENTHSYIEPDMSRILKLFWNEIQKTQTRCGGVLFIVSFIFWFVVLIFISGYVYQQDAKQFHCKLYDDNYPVNKTLNSKCYASYSKLYNNPTNFGTFALVNGLVLLLGWVVYLLCAFGRLPHDSHLEENPRRPAPTLVRCYVIQLSFRTFYLVVMMALIMGLIPTEFPSYFKCSIDDIRYKCYDVFSTDKTHVRKAILIYDGMFGLLTFWELFYVVCR